MKPIPVALALALILSRAHAQEPQAPELLEGVHDLVAPGVPSPLVVWSKEAWVVLAGNDGEGVRAAAVVAGKAVAGRFVALPHNNYFASFALEQGETGRFLVNAVRWCAGEGKPKPRVAARSAELVALLNQSGCEAHALGAKPLAEELADVDVVCGITNELAAADIVPLQAFLSRGGGVIAGQCAWGWQQIHGALTLDDNPLNRCFGRFGVSWAPGYLGKVGEIGFASERAPPELVHGEAAMLYLVSHLDPAKIEDARPMIQSIATLAALVQVLPRDDTRVRPRLEQWLTEHGQEIVPSPAQPIVAMDGMRRSLLAFALCESERRTAGEVRALPSARLFPGEVAAAAPRVARSVAIDPSVPRWHSTGLYAAAGEAIRVHVPAGAESAGLLLQIGAHTDELFDLPEWKRAPRIVRRVALDRAEVSAASAFGGLVYIVVPEGCALGKIEVGFDHVVESPRFVLDRDTTQDWLAALRQRTAPWAELESSKIILTVPATAIRALADPEALLRTWDRVADAAADLVALPRARRSPERYVADVQISAGYMHSGYPIGTHLDAAAVMASPERMAQGDWGLFHELGHNHQEGDWTFAGTGEVTNNVICLYILETVCGRKPASGGELFQGVTDGARRLPDWFRAGADFEKWKQDPFLALQFYVQVQQAFGWEPYRKIFRDYRGLPRSDQPKNDDAKRDLWLVMLSRSCGRNLSRFFTTWNIPTSEAARASIADLAEWMPEGFPPH